MEACVSCGKRIPNEVPVCAFCGARQADGSTDDAYDPGGRTTEMATSQRPTSTEPAARRKRQAPLPSLPTPGMVVMGEAARGGPRKGLVASIAIALTLAGAAGAWLLTPAEFPVARLTPVGAEEEAVCRAAPRCVLVYLAPWSEASQESLSVVNKLREELDGDPDVGFAIVVGHDTPDRVQRYAESLGAHTWADEGDVALRAVGLETAPSWFVLDGAGKVLSRVEGTFFPYDLHLARLGIQRG